MDEGSAKKQECGSLEVELEYYIAKQISEQLTPNELSGSNISKLLSIVTLPLLLKSLSDFGYKIDDNLELRNIKTGSRFQFVNADHYDAIGEQILQYIHERMKNEYNFEEVLLPIAPSSPNDPRCKIFLTKDALTNPNKLLLLIHGSGHIRAGQWARRPCFNQSLKIGSILPYLEQGNKDGYGMIVLSPNHNFEMITNPQTGKQQKVEITGNATPEEHLIYVWERFVRKAKASKIFIVAHSYGGTATLNLIEKKESEFVQRVVALALSNSVMYFNRWKISKTGRVFFRESCANWLASELSIGTPIANDAQCICLSSGDKRSENTAGRCTDAIFNYFRGKW